MKISFVLPSWLNRKKKKDEELDNLYHVLKERIKPIDGSNWFDNIRFPPLSLILGCMIVLIMGFSLIGLFTNTLQSALSINTTNAAEPMIISYGAISLFAIVLLVTAIFLVYRIVSAYSDTGC